MLHPDPRAYRVALLADSVANEPDPSFDVLGMLDAADFGVVVLPPSDFVIDTISSIVEYVVDDLVDYRSNGYRVVVIGASDVDQFGVWLNHVDHELNRRSADPFDVFDIVGAVAADLQRFLDAALPAAQQRH